MWLRSVLHWSRPNSSDWHPSRKKEAHSNWCVPIYNTYSYHYQSPTHPAHTPTGNNTYIKVSLTGDNKTLAVTEYVYSTRVDSSTHFKLQHVFLGFCLPPLVFTLLHYIARNLHRIGSNLWKNKHFIQWMLDTSCNVTRGRREGKIH